jgi:hypothetical protein
MPAGPTPPDGPVPDAHGASFGQMLDAVTTDAAADDGARDVAADASSDESLSAPGVLTHASATSVLQPAGHHLPWFSMPVSAGAGSALGNEAVPALDHAHQVEGEGTGSLSDAGDDSASAGAQQLTGSALDVLSPRIGQEAVSGAQVGQSGTASQAPDRTSTDSVAGHAGFREPRPMEQPGVTQFAAGASGRVGWEAAATDSPAPDAPVRRGC